jgi:phenylethanolamine N-methyltransferase
MSRADPSHIAGSAYDSDPGQAAVALAYQRFEPRAYLRNNYAPPRGDLSSPDGVGPWKLRCLAQTFATGEHRERGTRDKKVTRVKRERRVRPGECFR